MNKYVMVVDTETANGLAFPLPYDIGGVVLDTITGEIVEQFSYVVAEVFLDRELMSTAYYCEKVPTYWEQIKSGERKLCRLLTIRKAVLSLIDKFGIKRVFAYNMGFDKRSTNNDCRKYTDFVKWFFPYGIELLDIWNACCNSLLNTKKYVKWAKTHGFVSPAGNIQTSAEVAYRYLTNDPEFIEKHQGLEDCLIEAALLMNCVKRKVKMEYYQIYSACWRVVQTTRKELEASAL